MGDWDEVRNEPGAAKYLMITTLASLGIIVMVAAFIWVVVQFGAAGGLAFIIVAGMVAIIVVLQLLDARMVRTTLQAAADMTASTMGASAHNASAVREQWRAIGADSRMASQEFREMARLDRQIEDKHLAPWEDDEIDTANFRVIE